MIKTFTLFKVRHTSKIKFKFLLNPTTDQILEMQIIFNNDATLVYLNSIYTYRKYYPKGRIHILLVQTLLFE